MKLSQYESKFRGFVIHPMSGAAIRFDTDKMPLSRARFRVEEQVQFLNKELKDGLYVLNDFWDENTDFLELKTIFDQNHKYYQKGH